MSIREKKKKTNTEERITTAIFMAIVAAALYGISSPMSKLLLVEIPPTFLAALLYLGAGLGMGIINIIRKQNKKEQVEAKITKKEVPYVVGMIVLDVIAPILLMLGLTKTTSGNASLLNNFEIVATSLIALFIFKEAIGKRMWIAITFITLSTIILSVDDFSAFSFSTGSFLVVAACLCWGFENNCTRMLSLKDPLQIVVIKGLGSGLSALLISFALNSINGNAFLYLACITFRFFCLWTQYLLLYHVTKRTWCFQNKCLLCCSTIYRGVHFLVDIEGRNYDYFPDSTCSNAYRRIFRHI